MVFTGFVGLKLFNGSKNIEPESYALYRIQERKRYHSLRINLDLVFIQQTGYALQGEFSPFDLVPFRVDGIL